MTMTRMVCRAIAVHHNRIQFFGYEVANVVLVIQQTLNAGTTPYGLTFETYAALSLLIGSACIWRFDCQARPSMLYWGGMALALGGVFLIGAGYTLSGVAVTLASLETARGGMSILRKQVDGELGGIREIATPTRIALSIATLSLGWYVAVVDAVTSRWIGFGRFVNERPFLTGALIKAPTRLEFVAKKIVEGDAVGAAVGLSWMILGDGALAFNDTKLKTLVIELSRPRPMAAPE